MRTRTYAASGVTGKREMTKAVVRELRFRRRSGARLLGGIGHFTGILDLGDRVLSVTTDSVGTKVLVADALRKYDTIGIDCIAANVNDLVCSGLEPVAFVDYIAINRHDERVAAAIARGLDRGAREANVSIVGGEVAVMPELVNGFDFVGTAVGVGRKEELITGERIAPDDALIGVASSGIHANGLTLARRVFKEAGLGLRDPFPGSGRGTVGQALLEPTAIYVKPVRKACARGHVKGIANITGGGLRNLTRLKERVEFVITEPMTPQAVFTAIQRLASIPDEEMYQTFNMGMGLTLVVSPRDVRRTLQALQPLRAAVVGRVRRGRGVSVEPLGLRYSEY